GPAATMSGSGAAAGSVRFRRERQSFAPLFGLFFNVRPTDLLPVTDGLFVALQRPSHGPLAAPAECHQNLPHVTRMIANAKFLLDQVRHAFGSPQAGFIAQPLGTCEKALFKPTLLSRAQPRFAARAPGLAQSALATFPVQRCPTRPALAHPTQPPRHFGLVQSLPQQPQGFEPSPFESIKITSYSSRVSHTRLDARYPEKCRYIMRYSIIEVSSFSGEHYTNIHIYTVVDIIASQCMPL